MMEKGSKSRFSNIPCLLGVVVIASSLVSCSSSPKTVSKVEPSVPASVLPAALPDLPPPPPIREVTPSAAAAVKVLSDGREGNLQPSLIEASRMAKAKKRNEGEARPTIEITDENLRDYSSGGQVFVLETGESVNPVQAGTATATPSSESTVPSSEPRGGAGMPASESTDREAFWRQSTTELRSSLRRTVDDLKRIELESTLLRQQFYSESDPFVRDSEIKPRWDRALDQMGALRKKAKEDRNALSSLLTEAGKSGIPVEWLEDGSSDLTDEEVKLINGPGATGQR